MLRYSVFLSLYLTRVCLLFMASGMLCLLPQLAFAAQAKVKDIRVWHGPDSSRIVFDLSRSVSHRVFLLSDPERILIDLPNTRVNSDINVEMKEPLRKIRHGKPTPTSSRIVVELSRPSKFSSFLLSPRDNYGHRLVVDILKPSNQPVAPKALKEYRDVIVAIDAGHGGGDGGAVANGIKEKDIVLEYSQTLAKEINSRPGLRAVLVRDGDYFIPLGERMKIARKKGADFFISVHANSFPDDKRVNGFMLFALSDRGASSEVARWMARSENKSNARGGISNLPEVEKGNKKLKKIILDLSMNSVLNQSILAGRNILKSVGQHTRLHNSEVETANFQVLRAPDVPALLLELGFLTSKKDVKKLTSKQFKGKVIKSIASGLEKFFYDYPPYDTKIAELRSKQLNDNKLYYTVEYGDTLSEIALQTTVPIDQLRRMNNLQNDNVLAGQKLLLRELPKQQISYKVQSGDSLSTIAAKFGIQTSQLRAMNNLDKGYIYPGQELTLYKEERPKAK